MCKKNYITNLVILTILIFTNGSLYSSSLEKRIQQVDQTVNLAVNNILELQNQQANWDTLNYSYGIPRAAQSWLTNRIMGTDEYLDKSKLKQMVLDTQLENGSWEYLLDANNLSGDINATILNYLFLKSILVSPADPRMIKAKNYVRSKGGVQQADPETKFFLSLLGAHHWNEFSMGGWVPPEMLNSVIQMEEKSIALWVSQTFYPILYLLMNKVLVPLAQKYPQQYKIDELYLNQTPSYKVPAKKGYRKLSQKHLKMSLHIIEEIILKRQNAAGGWSAYINATTLNILCLQHYSKFITTLRRKNKDSYQQRRLAEQSISRAFAFVKKYSWDRPDFYQGLLTDSRFWWFQMDFSIKITRE